MEAATRSRVAVSLILPAILGAHIVLAISIVNRLDSLGLLDEQCLHA